MSRSPRPHSPRPYPTRPAQSSRGRHGPKTNPPPQVPFGFWLTDAASGLSDDTTSLGDGADISRTVPLRAISEFSKPGDRILLAGDDPVFLARVAECAPNRDSTCTTIPADTEGDRSGVVSAAYEPAGYTLVATLQPPQRSVEVATYQRWADLLRPGGVFVVITTNPTGPDEFHNHVGAVITAAGATGLVYLQHIVAVCAYITGDRLLVPTRARRNQLRRADGAVLHAPMHHDVIVLYRPAHNQESR